jgi:hypothetical protein
MTQAGAALTFLFVLVVLISPRPWAALGVFAAVCYVTQDQELVIVGLHFTAIRVVLLAGLIRLFLRGEYRGFRLNKIDSAIIAFISATTLISTFRIGTSEEVVYRLGGAYDILLSYFVLRGLLTNLEEIELFFRGLALLIIPLAMEMMFELSTHRNLFDDTVALDLREGRPRCEGAFRHGITAGVFGATLMPLFAGFLLSSQRRGVLIAGLFAAAAITYTSNSSGPLMAFMTGLIALSFWRWRRDMKVVRWSIVLVLLGLHIVMKAPVWFIIARLADLTGGDGWFRAKLIDQFLRHFSDWWLIGTSKTGDWMPTQITFANGEVSADITNQYVAAGVTGGLLSLILFVLILVRCFRGLGIELREARDGAIKTEILFWCFGCSLVAHVVTLFSVTYFDQMQVAWWGFLGIVASATSSVVMNPPIIELQNDDAEQFVRTAIS